MLSIRVIATKFGTADIKSNRIINFIRLLHRYNCVYLYTWISFKDIAT